MENIIYYSLLTLFTYIVIFLSVNLVLLANNHLNVSTLRKYSATLFMTIVNLFPYIINISSSLIVSFGITLCAMFLSYCFILRGGPLKGCIFTFTHLVISIICEFSGMLVINIFQGNQSINQIIQESRLGFVVLRFASIVIILILTALVTVYKKKFQRAKLEEPYIKNYSIIIQIVLTMFLVVPNILYFDYIHNMVSTFMILFNCLSAFALVFYSLYNIKKQNELAMRERELEILKMTSKSMELSLEKLREFKHDFPNFIQSVSGCAYLEDIEGLKKLLQSAKADYSICKTTPILDSHFKKAPAFYGIFLSKLMVAEAQNIEMDMRVVGEVNTKALMFPRIDKVFGILMDNALEAAQESEERILDVKFLQENGYQTIVISNSYAGQIDPDKITQQGFSTKEKHSGIGLFEVQRIVNSSGRLSLTTEVGKRFTQTLSIELPRSLREESPRKNALQTQLK